MDPYTPLTTSRVRKKNLTLSTKEYTKITGTIASARRNRGPIPEEYTRDSRAISSLTEPSFIAESSFIQAPLNSRVGQSLSAPQSKGKSKAEPLDALPMEIQEALILEDLLYVLMGIEGVYITHHPEYSPEDDDPVEGVKFIVSPTLDPSLRDLVERILPLGTYFTAISAFIEERSHSDFGLVNHALCASIRAMLKDYQTLLSQLEHAFNSSPSFSLQKLWFYVHPTTHTLALLYTLTMELSTAADAQANAGRRRGRDGSLSSSSSSSSSSELDPEEEARNEALGLGGAKLKAVLSQIEGSGDGEDASGIPVKGGEVLTIIYERQQNMSGDPEANLLYGTLLRDAGRPYVEMLKVWVTTGKLDDAYEELLVKESSFINRGLLESDYTDEYWERRYTLRDGSTASGSKGGHHHHHQAGMPPRRSGGRLPGGACIPPSLERWKHKILLAGKYLNVLRECGSEIPPDSVTLDREYEVSMSDDRFYEFLESAYTFANRTLLHLLLKDQQIIPRLRSLKHYFFLSHSSFLTHLLDLSSFELRKSSKSASLVKLQSMLDLALNTDASAGDGDNGIFRFRDDVKISMASSGLYEWLIKVDTTTGMRPEDGSSGGGMDHQHQQEPSKAKDGKDKTMLAIDAMTLDYNVKFPLSLVISRKTIVQYQLIFRFLLNLKHVEQSLSTMWIEQQTDPWRRRMPNHPGFEAWRLRVVVLRARMLAFVQQILSFAAFEVLEPNWRKLESKLEKVTSVDQLLRDHVDFLATCLKECMLTSHNLVKAFSKLIYTCSTFALYNASFTKSATSAITAATAAAAAVNNDKDKDSENENENGNANVADGGGVNGNGNMDRDMSKRWEFLHRFETNFNHWFSIHLDCVQFYASSENASLLPLVVRLSSIKG